MFVFLFNVYWNGLEKSENFSKPPKHETFFWKRFGLFFGSVWENILLEIWMSHWVYENLFQKKEFDLEFQIWEEISVQFCGQEALISSSTNRWMHYLEQPILFPNKKVFKVKY